jgi:RNA polymerase sigma-70 factor (ECF subfamily)
VEDLTALALAAGRGDRAALERFVRLSYPDVWRFCAHLVGAPQADDLAQDTFVRVIPALRSFEGRSSARTFVLAIARRACADWIRRRQRRSRLMGRLTSQPIDLVEPSGGTHVELDLIVADLDPERREAFVLTQVLGLSYAEAAQVCGCPVGTIRSRVARARIELMGRLGHLGDVGNSSEVAVD